MVVVPPLRKVVAENGKGGRRFHVSNGVTSDGVCRVVGFDGALDDDLDVFGGCVRDEAVNDDTGVRRVRRRGTDESVGGSTKAEVSGGSESGESRKGESKGGELHVVSWWTGILSGSGALQLVSNWR